MNNDSFEVVAICNLIGKIFILMYLSFLLTAKDPDLLDSLIKLIGGL